MFTAYGTTEIGGACRLFKRKKEDEAFWDYMEFSEHTNIRWMPQGDGTYECQFQVNNYVFLLEFRQLIDGVDMRYTYLGS